MTKQQEIIDTIKVLRKEIEVLTSRLQPHTTGHLHTAIGVINSRIEELIEEVTAPYFDEDEDAISNRNRQYIEENEAEEEEALSILAEQSRQSKIYGGGRPLPALDEDVYDGYKEHTEAMEQARLRKIQDAAAGRSEEVEHTKEYYDTERNKPMEGQDLEGLSNRTMKQKHGQAVMTVSEMMQDELEPLPINTFK